MPVLDLWSMAFVFLLATFVGFQVIQNVSRLLHTPLMSLTNAISAIAVVGSIIIAGEQKDDLQHRPRHRRGRRLRHQHRQRLPDHRPDAEDVPRAEATVMTLAEHLTQASYLAAAALFILSLRWLSDPKTARRGVPPASPAWRRPIVGTLLHPEIVNYTWIVVAMVIGTAIGVPLSRVPLTAVPQRTALSHAFGGLAAGLVGTAKYFLWLRDGELTTFRMGAIGVEVILGYLTFTGSLMAAGKLQEIIPTRPMTYRGQNVVNLGAARGRRWRRCCCCSSGRSCGRLFPLIIVLSLAFGVLLIMPIGGADMPTVISLLNAYAGLAAVAMGFVLENKVLITAGALDGSSGLILSVIMCRAMNRSFTQRAVRRLRSGPDGRDRDRGAERQERDPAGRRRPARECVAGRHCARATGWRSRRPSTASARFTTS